MTLQRASPDDALLLAGLLNLYMHDMSAIFPVAPGADGVFRYEGLSRYWSEPATRFPFLIHVDGRVSGFALATRGVQPGGNRDLFDVAEFFVLRAHRRAGVGREAAFLLWDHLPGKWMVRVSTRNPDAAAFWRACVGQYTRGVFGHAQRAEGAGDWEVFTFANDTTAGRTGARYVCPAVSEHLMRTP